jgi:hypothetical protein
LEGPAEKCGSGQGCDEEGFDVQFHNVEQVNSFSLRFSRWSCSILYHDMTFASTIILNFWNRDLNKSQAANYKKLNRYLAVR